MSKQYHVIETTEAEAAFPIIDKIFQSLEEAQVYYDGIDIRHDFIVEQGCATVKNTYREFSKSLIEENENGEIEEYLSYEEYSTINWRAEQAY